MRTLQLEDLCENPRNVLSLPLPEHPTRLLLLVAQIAAVSCREIAELTINQLKEVYGECEISPPELSDAFDDWHLAYDKAWDVCYSLHNKFGLPISDFDFSRVERQQSVCTRVTEFVERLLS